MLVISLSSRWLISFLPVLLRFLGYLGGPKGVSLGTPTPKALLLFLGLVPLGLLGVRSYWLLFDPSSPPNIS